ncbi:drug/metabolite transporter (DMT)-like permease [Psychrobacter sp. PL15]|uniref:DMT family transporter n=1 Tax=Psychrobacter sp. PL15 TaxID=3071719 RepID=UPI002DFFA95C|nr:drug/metabolite transporter (DMT)-like permease [Psychrobacter sp. PL15]
MKSSTHLKEYKDNLPLAVLVIIIAVLALSLGDALIKFTSAEFVIWQIFVLRSLLVMPILLLYLWIKVPSALSVPPALGWTMLRSVMLVGMWLAYYLALPNLDLSIAAATYYTLPIFITLFSAVFIGDKISRLGWMAVIVGFLGVLLILRPKAGDFNLFAILPLISAVLYALSMILTRTKCRDVNPVMLSLVLNLTFIIVGTLAAFFISSIVSEPRKGFLLASWTNMGFVEWALMALLAVAILIGSVGAAIAYQKAPPAVIGTFDFAYVGFAILWGLVFFAEVPDMLSLIGIFLIVVAGFMSLRQ